MKVTYKSVPKAQVTFGDLEVGDLFRRSDNKGLFIKTQEGSMVVEPISNGLYATPRGGGGGFASYHAIIPVVSLEVGT